MEIPPPPFPLQGFLHDPHSQVGRTPFYLVHQGESDIELMRALVSVYDAAAPSLRFVAPHCDGGVSGNERVFVSDGGEAGRRPARIGQPRTKRQ